MKYLLIGVEDTTDLIAFDKTLHTIKGVKTVETISPKKSQKINDPTEVLQRNLSIPGLPLTDSEIEVLAEAMDSETEFLSHKEVWTELEERFKSKEVA